MVDFEWTPQRIENMGKRLRSLASWDFTNENIDRDTQAMFDIWLEAVKKQSFDEGYVEAGLDRDG